MSDDKTYDLTVPGLTEQQLRWVADSNSPTSAVEDAARAKLAEIDAERAAAVKATERVTFRLSEIVGNSSTGIWRTTVLASDLRAGDVVEGRTVAVVTATVGQIRVHWGDLADGHSVYYQPGVLVLLDSESDDGRTA